MSSPMFWRVARLSPPDNGNSAGRPPQTRPRRAGLMAAHPEILERGAPRAVRFGGVPIAGVS